MVRSSTNSEGSAATQVKAVSPEICLARGQGVVRPEASIEVGVSRRVYHDMPGLQVAAGPSGDGVGTWESRIACLPQQAEEARRGQGDTAVGPAHSRGVAGVTPGAGRQGPDPLEGAGGQLHRIPNARPILRDGMPPGLGALGSGRVQTLRVRACPRPVGKDKTVGVDGAAVLVLGDWLKSRMREICTSGSVRGRDGLGQGRIV